MSLRLPLMMVALIVLIVLFAFWVLGFLLSTERGRTILKLLLIVPALVILVGVFLLFTHRIHAEREMQSATVELSDMERARAAALLEHARQTSPNQTTDAVAEAEEEPPREKEAKEAKEAEEEPPGEKAAQQPAPEEDRPDWVEASPRKVGAAYQMSISVGPYSTRLECDREIPHVLEAAIGEYVTAYLGHRAHGQVHLPMDYAQAQIVKAEWAQEKQVLITPAGQIPQKHVPMIQLHLLLEFDHAANDRIQKDWEKVVVTRRLYGVGALTALVLVLLSAAYTYLKIDLATGGAYRGRLRLATAGVILLLIVAGLTLYLAARVGGLSLV